jgi:hypothetical protein
VQWTRTDLIQRPVATVKNNLDTDVRSILDTADTSMANVQVEACKTFPRSLEKVLNELILAGSIVKVIEGRRVLGRGYKDAN